MSQRMTTPDDPADVDPSVADIVFTLGLPEGDAVVSAATSRGQYHLLKYLRNYEGQSAYMDPKFIEVVTISAQAFGLRTRVDRIGVPSKS